VGHQNIFWPFWSTFNKLDAFHDAQATVRTMKQFT